MDRCSALLSDGRLSRVSATTESLSVDPVDTDAEGVRRRMGYVACMRRPATWLNSCGMRYGCILKREVIRGITRMPRASTGRRRPGFDLGLLLDDEGSIDDIERRSSNNIPPCRVSASSNTLWLCDSRGRTTIRKQREIYSALNARRRAPRMKIMLLPGLCRNYAK